MFCLNEKLSQEMLLDKLNKFLNELFIEGNWRVKKVPLKVWWFNLRCKIHIDGCWLSIIY